MNSNASSNGRRLINRSRLRELIGASDMTVWRWEQAGTFPRHVNISGRNYWDADEVEAWVEAQLAGREAPDAA